jgi:unsaturated rhamnogalacturonyl hydrolase
MRRRILISAGAVTAGVALVGTVALAGGANAGVTAAAKPGPGLNKAAIVKVMTFVDNYWVKNGTDEASNNWKNATFHVGNLAYVTTSGVSNHITLPWATANKFKLPTDKRGPFFPDTFAPGEVYLDLQAFHPADSDLADLRKKIKAQVTDVKNGNVSTWNYVDALNMAMPEYARMAVIDKNSGYLSTMQTLFNYTEKVAGGKGLYSEKDSLWWRDSKYVNTTTFWSRGNGWAFMALAKVMTVLPSTDKRYAEYSRVFQAMAAKLVSIQRSDGFWNVDLGDAKNFPGDETTGTAMFTYGLAWGVHNGLLKLPAYRTAAQNAWIGMVNKAVQTSGLLGFCQGTGQRPSDGQPVTKSSTSAVGVGAFLLAGSQLALIEPAK